MTQSSFGTLSGANHTLYEHVHDVGGCIGGQNLGAPTSKVHCLQAELKQRCNATLLDRYVIIPLPIHNNHTHLLTRHYDGFLLWFGNFQYGLGQLAA